MKHSEPPDERRLTTDELVAQLTEMMQNARKHAAPTPESFGLHGATLPAVRAEWERAKRQCLEQHTISVLACVIGLFAVGIVTWSWGVLWLALFPGLWVGVVILIYTLNDLCRVQGFESLDAYDRAVREWEAEQKRRRDAEERTRRDFWLSLPNGYVFEMELARVYENVGYTVELTRKSGDGGIDIWLRRENETAIVQCKHHASRIGVAAARELLFLRASHGADRAILAGISGFTAGVHALAAIEPLELVDLSDILAMQKQSMCA